MASKSSRADQDSLVMANPDERKPARFRIGIDLGTTNCALASIDSIHEQPRIDDFEIPQVAAPNESERRAVLPSFSYEPAEGEFPPGSLTSPGVPDGSHVLGSFARRCGALAPGRLIASAKSWLCHPGVDRTAPLLPWHGAVDVTRVSPVEASARYLNHLRAAWDAAHPSFPLAEQELVVTVPASFDEVARRLTLRAADKAGLGRLTLIEEPQAAFYSWMAASGADIETLIQPGQLTLICDVGGGTSDFTLIEARAGEDGRVRFHRVAVGQHLILGGDNMDLALAHHVEARLPGQKLDPRRWGMLVQACRQVKETLLEPDGPERSSVSVAAGSRLVGGALQVEVTRDEVRNLLLEGFFPQVKLGTRPAVARSGFQEFGLPYAADAAVTRHLSAFIADHIANDRGDASGSRFPDHILFNGGVFESAVLRERLISVLESWRQEAAPTGTSIRILPHARLDLAVARGAAYAAWLQHHPGRRIAAGLARSYYIQVGQENADAPIAVCVAPAGLEEGRDVVLPRRFQLRLRQPVEFVLFSSTTRTQDRMGDLIPIDPEQITALPPVRTVVNSGRAREAESAEVELHTRLTEIGTLDVRCAEAGGKRSWKLEFDVRSTANREVRSAPGIQTGSGGPMEESLLASCRERIRHVFHTTPGEAGDPSALVRELEGVTSLRKDRWSLPMLRALWAELMEVQEGRRRGPSHEARWLNLLGFALRPGYGYTVDDWRVQQSWRLFQAGTAFPKNEMCRAEWCILWRRLAGGLGVGHQRAIAEAVADVFRPRGGRKLHRGPHETAEIWRLLGGLELVALPVKIEMGTHLLERLDRRTETTVSKAMWWALGRLGARVPAYGPMNALVPSDTIEAWLRTILKRATGEGEAHFAVVQLCRPTGDRYRDIDSGLRAEVVTWLREQGAAVSEIQLARDGGALDAAQEQQVFGESLPPGLHLGDG